MKNYLIERNSNLHYLIAILELLLWLAFYGGVVMVWYLNEIKKK
jgi:hypothetical protein